MDVNQSLFSKNRPVITHVCGCETHKLDLWAHNFNLNSKQQKKKAEQERNCDKHHMSWHTTGSYYFSLPLNSRLIFLLNCRLTLSVLMCVSHTAWFLPANRAFPLRWLSNCVQEDSLFLNHDERSQLQFNEWVRVLYVCVCVCGVSNQWTLHFIVIL